MNTIVKCGQPRRPACAGWRTGVARWALAALLALAHEATAAPGRDDHGDTVDAASVLVGSVFAVRGAMEVPDDVDLFRFTTGAATVSLNLRSVSPLPGFRGSIELLDAGGRVLEAGHPTALDTTLTAHLSGGTYYLRVMHDGANDPPMRGDPNGAPFAFAHYVITGSLADSSAEAVSADAGMQEAVFARATATSADPEARAGAMRSNRSRVPTTEASTTLAALETTAGTVAGLLGEELAVPYVTAAVLGTLRNDFSGWVGMRIVVGAQPLNVSQLGRMMAPGNTASHALKLVRASDGADVAGGATTVTMAGGTAGQFRYGALPAPVTLAAGETYLLVTQETLGGDQWYDSNTLVVTTAVAVQAAAVRSGGSATPVSLSWNDNSWDETGFVVERAVDTGGFVPLATLAANSISYVDTSPPPGLVCSYRVRAVNAIGMSAPTNVVSQLVVLLPIWQVLGVAGQSCGPVDFKYDAAPAPVPVTTAYVTGTTLGTQRNNYGGWVGMQLVVGANPLRVTQLGRMMAPGNKALHPVKLVAAADGRDVPGAAAVVVMLGGTVGQFRYAPLLLPVTLAARTSYFLVSQETAGGDKWYDSNTRVVTTSAATTTGAIWGGVGDWRTAGGAGQTYVPVDFKHDAVPVVPVAGTTAFVTGTTLGTLRNNYGGWVGMQIVVGANPLTVTQLGRMMAPGNKTAHPVKLVTAADGKDVPGAATVVAMSGGTVGQFQYAALAAPVTLAARTSYFLVTQESAGGDSWHDSNSRVATTTAATVPVAIWGRGAGDWRTAGAAGQAYGPVDFKYSN